MVMTPADTQREARRIAARIAEELHIALLGRGFYLPMRAAPPLGGRAYIGVEPIRADVAIRLIDTLAPPAPAFPAMDDPWEEAEDAVAAMRRALWSAGVTLPSLAVDAPYGGGRGVLVTLGRARPAAVRRLATAVRAGAGLRPGALVVDVATGRPGYVVAEDGERYRLRPVTGRGPQWDAGHVRQPDARERLAARNARANARSRGDVL